MILSGNPHPQISEEAELLDLIRYCNGRVQGHVHAEHFSKQTVLEWMAEDGFTGEHLIMFGDGAEIKATRNLGGLSIGVCSDEAVNGSGVVDQSKRDIYFQPVPTPSSLTTATPSCSLKPCLANEAHRSHPTESVPACRTGQYGPH